MLTQTNQEYFKPSLQLVEHLYKSLVIEFINVRGSIWLGSDGNAPKYQTILK